MPKRKSKTITTGELSGTDGVPRDERNWSELPEKILHLFSKKLFDIIDFIRFRAVCKTWQLSAIDPPPQLPWLLEHRRDTKNATIRFHCLLSDKVHTITYPNFRNAWPSGPGYRYLLTSYEGNSDRYLLNPINGDQIRVPFVNFFGISDYIGPDPIEGSDILVISGPVKLSTRPKMMAFWHPKADDWVYVKEVHGSCNAFYMGQYFDNNTETGITNVIDIATKKLAYQVAPPYHTNPLLKGWTFLVESGGKILRLFEYYEAGRCHFDIYCLHVGNGEQKPCWVKITDIGDQMLFLEFYCGLSVCASNFAGFKGNCIYFLKYTHCRFRRYLCRYDIGDGTTEVLPYPFDSLETWFVPSQVLKSQDKIGGVFRHIKIRDSLNNRLSLLPLELILIPLWIIILGYILIPIIILKW